MNKCGAKTKAGTPCKKAGMENGRCRLHGGATPRGIAHPNTKHGRYSKDLPTKLSSKYEAALADRRLLELRDEVAIIDIRLSDLLRGVDRGGASELWSTLEGMVEEWRAADEDDREKIRGRIFAMIERGAKDWQRWRDVFGTIEKRVRVAESERRRLVEMQQMMTSEQAMVLLASVVDTIRKHVTDPNTLRGISSDLRSVLARESGRLH